MLILLVVKSQGRGKVHSAFISHSYGTLAAINLVEQQLSRFAAALTAVSFPETREN